MLPARHWMEPQLWHSRPVKHKALVALQTRWLSSAIYYLFTKRYVSRAVWTEFDEATLLRQLETLSSVLKNAMVAHMFQIHTFCEYTFLIIISARKKFPRVSSWRLLPPGCQILALSSRCQNTIACSCVASLDKLRIVLKWVQRSNDYTVCVHRYCRHLMVVNLILVSPFNSSDCFLQDASR